MYKVTHKDEENDWQETFEFEGDLAKFLIKEIITDNIPVQFPEELPIHVLIQMAEDIANLNVEEV